MPKVKADRSPPPHEQNRLGSQLTNSTQIYLFTEESTEIEPTDQARIQAANSGIRSSNSNNDDLGAMDEDDDPEPGAPLLTRLNLDTDPKSTSQRSGPNFSTVYTTTHKDMATSTAFSKDGRYAASGSADTSLKILDVNKMKLMNDDVHPVVRTLYDHDTVRPLSPSRMNIRQFFFFFFGCSWSFYLFD